MKNKTLSSRARFFGKACLMTIAAFVAVAAAPAVQADGNTVTVGTDRIAIPAVAGLDNYTDDPRGRQMATPLIESNAQLLSFQAQVGPASRYLIVKTPKEMMSSTMSVSEFRTFTAHSRASVMDQQRFGELATRQADEKRAQLNETLAPGHDIGSIKFDTPVVIGIDRDDDVAFTHTKLVPMQMSADGRSAGVTTVMCASAILVKGKFIIAQLFGPGNEVDWARSTCNKFVADLVTQNH